MALDGGFLYKLKNELCDNCKGAFVDKIYQPSRDELVFLLRTKGFVGRLLICANPASYRIQLTDAVPENPASPPMFCMLLRKYLGSARLNEISQPSLERILLLDFSAVNEMGDRINIQLAVELMGACSNIVLIGSDGRIIDAVHRSDMEKSRRIIQPGALYALPEATGKLSLLTDSVDTICQTVKNLHEIPLHKAVLNSIDGISPLTSREIAHLSAGDIDTPACDVDSQKLSQTLSFVKSLLTNSQDPYLIYKNNEVFDFSYIPIKQYADTCTCVQIKGFSSLLDLFYREKSDAKRMEQRSKDIVKSLNTVYSRIQRKTALRKNDLKKCSDREELRLYGELIKANIHNIKPGASSVTVQNYYDENLSDVQISLNPALSASANASKYFKDYKKTYVAEQTLTELIKQDEKELIYIESVLDSVMRCDSVRDLDEIRDELFSEGLIKSAKTAVRKKQKQQKPQEFLSPDGFKVYVGRNNVQNDYLTLKFAKKTDYWFHVKNIPGSHVIVECNDSDISDCAIEFAGNLAAKNSKARGSTRIAVDYTQVKNVKKPNGAKPGMVIYTTNKTVLSDGI